MNWEKGTRTVALKSIIAPGDVAKRQARPGTIELAKDIAELGGEPMHPMVVRKVRQGWQLIAGRDRYSALLLNGVKRASVRVVEEATAQELHDLEVSENLHRRQDDRAALLVERMRKLVERVKAERVKAERSNSGQMSGDRPGKPGPKKSVESEARERLAAETNSTPEAVRKELARAEESNGNNSAAKVNDAAQPIETWGAPLHPQTLGNVIDVLAVLDCIASHARSALTAAAKLGSLPMPEAARDELRTLAQALGAAARLVRPVAACPYCCRDASKQEGCSGCGGAGYVAQAVLTSAPPELMTGNETTVAKPSGKPEKPKKRITIVGDDGKDIPF